MKLKSLPLAFGFAVLACLSMSDQTTYNFTTVNYPHDTFTQLLGINKSDEIAGYHSLHGDRWKSVYHGFALAVLILACAALAFIPALLRATVPWLVAILAAVFSHSGGYTSGQAFVDGLTAALWVGAGVVDNAGRYLGLLAVYDAIFAIICWASFEYVVTE